MSDGRERPRKRAAGLDPVAGPGNQRAVANQLPRNRFTSAQPVGQAHRLAGFVPYKLLAIAACLVMIPAAAAWGQGESHTDHRSPGSIADNRVVWPTRGEIVRVVTLRDYNTRIVLLGTMLLGVVGGVVGTFMLLRKRALVGDVVGHASLPGIATAFIVLEIVSPGEGKSLPWLLAGAWAAGLASMGAVIVIRKATRIKEDAALAIVLSVTFGLGVALFTIVQNLPTGNAAGLSGFIFGKAASMVAADVILIAEAAAVVLVVSALLFKEFSLLCFDEGYAAAQGWPVTLLDVVLMGLVAGVTVIGLQSVGVLLVVALLIIPPAAARFWTDHLLRMTLAAAAIGGLSAAAGVLASALFPRLAAGGVIVLAGAACFIASMLFGSRRGIVRRIRTQRALQAKIGRDDLLRAFYEHLEPLVLKADPTDLDELSRHAVRFDELLAMRSWTAKRLRGLLDAGRRGGLVHAESTGAYRLTDAGADLARRVARNHRLWELFLITHADVAASRVDRGADLLEHVLEPELVDELETQLAIEHPHLSSVPPSPHPGTARIVVPA